MKMAKARQIDRTGRLRAARRTRQPDYSDLKSDLKKSPGGEEK